MNNYRTFQRSYVEHLSETSCFTTSASVGYRSALTATFFRINGNYGHTRDNQIYGYEYRGATSVVHAIDKKNYTDNYAFGFDGSKGFDWLQSTFVLLVAIVIVRVSASLLRIFILSILEQSVLEAVALSLLLHGLILSLPADMHGMCHL